MARSKHHKRDEDLEGLVRQLKSEIRNLKKRLRYFEKREHLFEKIEEPDEERVKYPRCGECKSGMMVDIVVANRLIKKCNSCNFREKAVKI